jgi:hypothetical protein
MNKKLLIFIILAIIISISIAAALNFKYIKRYFVFRTTNFQGSMGAILSSPPPTYLAEGEAINKLQDALPLSLPAFTISSYDYSTGRFIVDLKSKIASEAVDFAHWYQASQYTAIPLSMFYLK